MAADTLDLIKQMKAKWFVFTLASFAAFGSAVLPLPAEIAMPVLTFLSVAALSGLVLAWLQAIEAARAAEKTAHDCRVLAGRLIRLEQHLQAPAANPALRSTMAEVTGTVGLLGGVVRELAKNVAAQNRDVADLKDTLKAAPNAVHERPVPVVHPAPTLLPQRPVQASVAERAPLAEPAVQRAEADMRRPEEDLRRMRLVTQAFEADRIELHLQPIVSLPQRKIRFYEALARLRLADGTLLGPAEFLNVLERLGRGPEFDRRVLNRAMAVARHLIAKGSEAIVGVNLSAHSIRQPGFLWSLTGLMDSSPDTLGKIVLELPQACWRNLDADQKSALAILRDKGVPLSLDRATDLTFDARELANLGVRFMKLPADQMVAAAEQDDGHHLGPELGVRDFASALRREGIRLIAEQVEREDTVPVLTELGVPLAQGFVFAAPRAVKAEVLSLSSEPPQAFEDKALLRRAG